jgi:predicted membrane protein
MNKKLLDIAGLIAFILGILCCITIFGAIVGIPMIIGGQKFREYSLLSDEEVKKNKDNILIWTIVFLFICQISGIIGLVFYFTMDENNIISPKQDKYSELEKLNQLYKDKVITKEEFEKEKEKILNK